MYCNNGGNVNGQEITIVRVNSGSFQELEGSDPDNNLPLSYQIPNLPDLCTYDATIEIITCQTDQQTPVRTEFVVIPVDSLRLAGDTVPFIVNIIEPDLTLDKSCQKPEAQIFCTQATILES